MVNVYEFAGADEDPDVLAVRRDRDPVRLMEASTALAEARRGTDQPAIARAQAAYDQVQREIAAHGTPPQ